MPAISGGALLVVTICALFSLFSSEKPTKPDKMESDTPETDAVSDYWLEPGMSKEYEIVKAEFARNLERRMNAQKKSAKHANQQLNKIVRERDMLREALIEMRYSHTDKAERMAVEALGENNERMRTNS